MLIIYLLIPLIFCVVLFSSMDFKTSELLYIENEDENIIAPSTSWTNLYTYPFSLKSTKKEGYFEVFIYNATDSDLLELKVSTDESDVGEIVKISNSGIYRIFFDFNHDTRFLYLKYKTASDADVVSKSIIIYFL